MDELLATHHPQNVVIILLDGLGSRILERALPESAFLRQNLKQTLTTVFPATTAAATSSIRTGLNPVEHGWTGWTAYIQPIDKIITLFLNTEKGNDETICTDYLAVKPLLVSETIPDQINQSTKYKALEIMPFGDDPYDGFGEMIERIKDEASRPGKKYIYAYSEESDATIHEKGPDSSTVKKSSKNKMIRSLSFQNHFTIPF